MRNLLLLFTFLVCFGLNANNLSAVKEKTCFEFADAVQANDGDSGDYETWSNAFEHCANTRGFETVIING